ncbi:MAG: Dickkopf N-terminal cysteine-rich domain-containing protein [Patescibacteria group bacterium]
MAPDTCVPHAPFGSSTNDCEQNYFEFTHAYSCGTQAEEQKSSKPICAGDKYCSNDRTQACSSNSDCGSGNTCKTAPGKGYCSRDNSVACSVDSECAPGDKCLVGLAPPDGCFDPTNNACRFTPRVELEDSWGWCTGECRIQDLGGGKLGANLATPGGNGNFVLFQNGGCYNGTGIYRNYDTTLNYQVAKQNGSFVQNTCDSNQTAHTDYRPWIVYNGALQLGVTP